eukprot:337244_1
MPLYFVLVLLLHVVYSAISNCPDTQTPSTHPICRIFKNTNIDDIFPTKDFAVNDYCIWTFTSQPYIQCTDGAICDIKIDGSQINGTLDLSHAWPNTMTSIDLEQGASHSTDLYGNWNWTSFEHLPNLNKLDLENNQVLSSKKHCANLLHKNDFFCPRIIGKINAR